MFSLVPLLLLLYSTTLPNEVDEKYGVCDGQNRRPLNVSDGTETETIGLH